MYKGIFSGTFFSTHTHLICYNEIMFLDYTPYYSYIRKPPPFQRCWFANPPFWGRSFRKFCSETDVVWPLGLICNIPKHPQTEWRIYSTHCLKVRCGVVRRGDKYCTVYCRQGCGVVLPSLEVSRNVLGRYSMMIEHSIFYEGSCSHPVAERIRQATGLLFNSVLLWFLLQLSMGFPQLFFPS